MPKKKARLLPSRRRPRQTPQQDFGFLRPINFGPSNEDIYISLRKWLALDCEGDFVAGTARPAKEGERYYGLMNVKKIQQQRPQRATDHIFQRLRLYTPIKKSN